MATRKKTSPESEAVRAEEFATAPKKRGHTRKTAGSDGSGPAVAKKTSAKSAAATHVAPARKTVSAAPSPETIAEAAVFDVAFHHEEISKEAYYTWLRNGCPQGSEQHDWLTAIEVVRARHLK